MNNDKIKIFEFDVANVQFFDNDPFTTIVSLQLLHLGMNRNRFTLTKQGVIDSIPTFFNKPIIYRLNNKFIPKLSTDVTTHANFEIDNFDMEDSTMNIAGQIPTNSRMDFVKIKDKEVLICDGIIHKRYQPTLMKILSNRNGNVKLSIEIMSEQEHLDEHGNIIIDRFNLMGVCLLGNGVVEGIEDSHLEVLHFSENKYNQSYYSFSQKNSFVIPDEVKMFAKTGLENRKKTGKGGCNSSISMASYLLNNNYISVDKIKKINQYFEKHDDMNNANAILFGGSCAKEWSNIILNANEDVKTKNEKEEINMKDEKETVLENAVETAKVDEKETVLENAVETAKVDEEEVVKNAVETAKVDEEEVVKNAVEDTDAVEDDDDKDETEEDETKDEDTVLNADGITFSQKDFVAIKEELNSLKEQLNASNKIVTEFMEFAKTFKETNEKNTSSEHVFMANRGLSFAEYDDASEKNLNKFLNKNKVVINSK